MTLPAVPAAALALTLALGAYTAGYRHAARAADARLALSAAAQREETLRLTTRAARAQEELTHEIDRLSALAAAADTAAGSVLQRYNALRAAAQADRDANVQSPLSTIAIDNYLNCREEYRRLGQEAAKLAADLSALTPAERREP